MGACGSSASVVAVQQGGAGTPSLPLRERRDLSQVRSVRFDSRRQQERQRPVAPIHRQSGQIGVEVPAGLTPRQSVEIAEATLRGGVEARRLPVGAALVGLVEKPRQAPPVVAPVNEAERLSFPSRVLPL